jgi:hypothetical protein
VLQCSPYSGCVLTSMASAVLSRASWSLARVGGALRLLWRCGSRYSSSWFDFEGLPC